MEYSDKVRWLRRYQEAQRLQQVLEEEAARLRAEAERVTPLFRDLPGSGGAGRDKLPAAVERIIDADQELQAQVNCCQAIRREVVEAINTVQDSRRHEVLHRRYLLGQRWEQIAVEMHLNFRWVTKLHRRSIENLALESPIEPVL